MREFCRSLYRFELMTVHLCIVRRFLNALGFQGSDALTRGLGNEIGVIPEGITPPQPHGRSGRFPALPYPSMGKDTIILPATGGDVKGLAGPSFQ